MGKAIRCREARGGAFRLVMGLGGLALAATGRRAEEYKIGESMYCFACRSGSAMP